MAKKKKSPATKGRKKVCFVVSPIGDVDSEIRIHADWFLEEILRPTFENFPEFELERADKFPQPRMIDSHIIRKLRDSDLVIADLSMLNANVFYEIGIRHMFQKPIIHMQLRDDEVPFDVSLYHAIKFSFRRPIDLRDAREELRSAVEAVISPEYEIDSPIIRAIGQINLAERATPEQEALLDKIAALERRLGAVETQKRPAAPADVARVMRAYAGKKVHVAVKFDKSLIDAEKVRVAIDGSMGGFKHFRPLIEDDYIELLYPSVDLTDKRRDVILKSLESLPGLLEVEIKGN